MHYSNVLHTTKKPHSVQSNKKPKDLLVKLAAIQTGIFEEFGKNSDADTTKFLCEKLKNTKELP